jgi:IclR family transcriptional regulator, mhp operon transcriptional activator
MERYAGVKSAERMFDIIELLNRSRGANVAQLASESGFSRRAIDRMLLSLMKYGYVRKLETDGKYYLTHLVRKLSDGFSEEEWVTDVASPILVELGQEILWPCDVATFVNDAMYLRDTSRRFSPFSIDWVTVGHRFPMMISATGRAYLTYCPEQEREEILKVLRRSDDQFDQLVNKRGYVETFIEETLQQGFSARCRRYIYDDRTDSIAVPVRIGSRVMGAIGVTGIASAVTGQELAERHLNSLLAARDKLELGIQNLKI